MKHYKTVTLFLVLMLFLLNNVAFSADWNQWQELQIYDQ